MFWMSWTQGQASEVIVNGLVIQLIQIQMSKTIEDYREIVKVLKLQLLKVREENSTLSKTLGIATQSETSSFTPRLDKLKNNAKQFAKHMYLYNLFAHKCELIGVTPQMVFRIADKKRDKKVSVADLTEIMKRLKLKFADTQIFRLLQPMGKSNNVIYDEYLQYINAFQINSEMYPPKSQRTFSQICLLKLGMEAKGKEITMENLFREISNKEGNPNISFQAFSFYCKNNTKLKDSQIICIFVTLDTSSECYIDRDNFMRQMNKISFLLDKGVSLDEESSEQTEEVTTKRKENRDKKKSDDEYSMEVDTGVQKGGQAKKQPKKQTKMSKGDLNKLVQQMKKEGISPSTLISKLIEKQQKRQLIRPFSLNDFSKIIQLICKNADKKKTIQFFKCLDTSYNGSVSTDELVKLWLEGRQVSDPAEILFRLLSRHFKQIQAQQYITKFSTSGFDKDDIITTKVLGEVFSGMSLKDDYLKLIENNLPSKCTVSRFVQLLETGGAPKSNKVFQPMKKADYENMNVVIKKLIPKEEKKFQKLSRLEGKSGGEKKYWDTIFTDEWSCWNYCLEVASKLKSYWRDSEFGPSTGDPSGYRSIVGNESEIPPGLPMEDQITWMTFQQLLEKQGRKIEEVKLFSDNLVANDIIQGKLGDCWFVSSLSIITSNDQFVKGKSFKECKANPEVALTFGIHPIIFHYFRQFGLYVFKFFKGFKPVYVIVDDLFPVEISNNQLIFAKSPDPGLQWVAFLEKAYSKLHHCYCNLISGDISQGLSDLTNTLPIKQSLVNSNPDELLQKMMKLSNQRQLMGCSINAPAGAGVEQPVTLDDERTGLFYGHAYSIGDLIDLKSISKQDFKLIKVRNPWGHGEWILDWSEKPANNDPDYKKLDKYMKDINKFYDEKAKKAKQMREDFSEMERYKIGQDGEFLMNFYDFSKIFSNLFTGYSLENKDYACNYLQGKWDKSMPSGLCKAKGASQAEKVKFVKDNYQFILEVKERTDIIMFLIQQDGRLFRGEKYPYKQICNGIIILSFNLEANQKMLDKFDNTKLTLPSLKLELKRETNYWHRFEPGRYAIVPCKMQNKIPETDFEFRMYSEKKVDIRKINGATGEFKLLAKSGKTDSASLQPMVDLVGKVSTGK